MPELHRIKRYANRKLYDTTTSCYVSLEKIHELIRSGVDVQIIDSQTGDDITSITLAQVVVEAEKHQRNLLPLEALKDLLQRGGESVIDFLQQSRRAGLGALSLADEAAGRTYERLVKQGQITQDEARELLESVTDNVSKQRRDVERTIDRRVRDLLDSMRLPSRAEVHALSTKLDRILAKLDDALEESDGASGRRGAARPAPKAKSRPAKGA